MALSILLINTEFIDLVFINFILQFIKTKSTNEINELAKSCTYIFWKKLEGLARNVSFKLVHSLYEFDGVRPASSEKSTAPYDTRCWLVPSKST